MSALPEAARLWGSGLPLSLGGMPPLPALQPASDEQVAKMLVLRMERGVLDVLRSDDEEFLAKLDAGLPDFLRKLVALREILPTAEEQEQQEVWGRVVEQAQDFGGDRWSDAAENSYRSIQWATRVSRRVLPAITELRPDVVERIVLHCTAVALWSWSAVALQVLMSRPEAARSAIQARVLDLLVRSATEAFTTVRSIQIELDEAAERASVEPEARPASLSDELRLLEEDAHQESIRLLRAIEA